MQSFILAQQALNEEVRFKLDKLLIQTEDKKNNDMRLFIPMNNINAGMPDY